jgi:hypothetical protein
MVDSRTIPAELEIHYSPRQPVDDPTLGIVVEPVEQPVATNRLVTVGDSLTHGFMSLAVFKTGLSWPATVAYELGLGADEFRFPVYEQPSGPGGIPLDLERFARAFESRFGPSLEFGEIIRAGLWAHGYLKGIEDYWDTGPGSVMPSDGPAFHNLAVYGWDVLDPQLLTAPIVEAHLAVPAKASRFLPIVAHNQDRAALPILRRAHAAAGVGTAPDVADFGTVLDAAARMGSSGEGIETLVVVLGSNNALGSVVKLAPAWTPQGYEDLPPAQRLEVKKDYNVWRPAAFKADWEDLVRRLRGIGAQHVVVATVPSVTIAPIAHGTPAKIRADSRYFEYYTRPWIADDDFEPNRDPNITADEARAIDSAIDAYNETIIASVAAARRDGLDWYVLELGGVLDRLATRRYVQSPQAQPPWWTPYPLPPALAGLDPVPDTSFFRSGPEGRTSGGLFSLDGVHPTTTSYGIIAQEVIRVMELAGVVFVDGAGQTRQGPIVVDFARLLSADTLLGNPPAAVGNTLGLLGWLDERLDWVHRILPFAPNPM